MWDPQVVVTGAAQTPFNRRKDGSGPRDWALAAFEHALEMSGIEPAQIEALYLSSESDFFALQLNPASVIATELGLAGAAAMRCESGGASGQSAVHAAVMAIQSGLIKHAVVLGLDASASGLPADKIRTLYGFSFDNLTDGLTGLSATALYALSWQHFAAANRLDDSHLTSVTLQNRANACANPDAHLARTDTAEEIESSAEVASPYRRLHCSPLSDGAAVLILSHVDESPRPQAPRIAGIGGSTDLMHLGARPDPGAFRAKQQAMQKACGSAGIHPKAIGVAEVYDAYAGAQLQALQALGLSASLDRDQRDGAFSSDGRCPINLSGGLMGQGAPAGAIGVAQVATAARVLEGRYHDGLQPAELPEYALADTHGGVCTTAAVTILKRSAAL